MAEPPSGPEVVVTGDTPKGRITGDRRSLFQKARLAQDGDVSAAAELRVAKLLRTEGRNVHFIDDLLTPRRTNDLIVDGVNADIKRIAGLGRNAAGDLAKGVHQVGSGGQVIVVRPANSSFTLEQFYDFVSNFTPKQPGVTFRVVDEALLPRLFF